MSSFQIPVTAKRRAASRFVVDVRRSLQKGFADAKRATGLNQAALARRLGVHRSVVTRELRGEQSIGLGRAAELAWAMGYEPHFELRRGAGQPGQNIDNRSAASPDIQDKLASVASEPASKINDLLTKRVPVPA